MANEHGRPDFLSRDSDPNDLLNKLSNLSRQIEQLQRSSGEKGITLPSFTTEPLGTVITGNNTYVSTGSVGSDEVESIEVSVRTTNGVVVLIGYVNVDDNKNGVTGNAALSIAVKRNGTAIQEVYANSHYVAAAGVDLNATIVAMDIPGIGIHTYTLNYETFQLATNPGALISSGLVALEGVPITTIRKERGTA